MSTATVSTETTEATEKPGRCNAGKVKVGSVFSRHSHGTVISKEGRTVRLRNEQGYEWDVIGTELLEKEFSFADQYEETVKESQTKVIEEILRHPHTAMTVVFKKKPDPNHVSKELAAGKGTMSAAAWKHKVADLLTGKERTIIGHHTGTLDAHQRLKFYEEGVGPRLVDLRTVKSVVVTRVNYVVK